MITKYKNLTSVCGCLTLQIKYNAFHQRERILEIVPTRLGEGTKGYLDLLLADTEYNVLTGTLFICPGEPRHLGATPAGTTATLLTPVQIAHQ